MIPRELLTSNDAPHLLLIQEPKEKEVYVANSKQTFLKVLLIIRAEHTQTTLSVGCAPQQMIPLESQSGGAVHRDESIAPRAEQRAQDPLLFQGAVSGRPQRLTQRLQLPAASTRAPRHHRQHAVYLLPPLLHLLQPSLRSSQFLHQVLDERVRQSMVVCA